MSLSRLLLIVSLSANLFIAGWWVGTALQRPQGLPQPFPFSMRDFIGRTLSAEGYRGVAPMLDRLDDIMHQGLTARQSTFDQLRALADAEPYDGAKVRQLLGSLPQQRVGSEATQWSLVADILDKLSAADRVHFADSVFLRPGPPPVGPNGGLPPLPPGGGQPDWAPSFPAGPALR
ncbi:MAG: periplasmic heavy metal sensor [Devosia sp.]|nr:periplasmic heavy metal sensor [Devosia sp.]